MGWLGYSAGEVFEVANLWLHPNDPFSQFASWGYARRCSWVRSELNIASPSTRLFWNPWWNSTGAAVPRMEQEMCDDNA